MSVTFADIHAMLKARPPLSGETPPGGAAILHALEAQGVLPPPAWIKILQNLASLQQKTWPSYTHPRVALYASNYGVDLDKTQARLEKLALQQDALTALCAKINADLRVYELDLTAQIPATGISEEEAAHALSYGLMAVEEHVDCLIVDTLSHGHETVLQNWSAALLKENSGDPLTLLLNCGGGHDLFALLGAVLAARMAKIPVFGGARLGAILPLALNLLLPGGEQDIFIALPVALTAPDVVQSILGLQQLQLLLALGPQVATIQMQKTVLPQHVPQVA